MSGSLSLPCRYIARILLFIYLQRLVAEQPISNDSQLERNNYHNECNDDDNDNEDGEDNHGHRFKEIPYTCHHFASSSSPAVFPLPFRFPSPFAPFLFGMFILDEFCDIRGRRCRNTYDAVGAIAHWLLAIHSYIH